MASGISAVSCNLLLKGLLLDQALQVSQNSLEGAGVGRRQRKERECVLTCGPFIEITKFPQVVKGGWEKGRKCYFGRQHSIASLFSFFFCFHPLLTLSWLPQRIFSCGSENRGISVLLVPWTDTKLPILNYDTPRNKLKMCMIKISVLLLLPDSIKWTVMLEVRKTIFI